MKRLIGALLLSTLIPLGAVAQKDWRQMERKRIVNQVSSLQLKNGLNEVANNPKGFKLFAVAKGNKITAWQAKDTKGRKLKVTKYEYPASADDSKEPGILKMIVICVEAKEVCYEVQLVPISQR
jgi:hypothetical protein